MSKKRTLTDRDEEHGDSSPEEWEETERNEYESFRDSIVAQNMRAFQPVRDAAAVL